MNRTSHIVYLTALIALAAMLVRQGNDQAAHQDEAALAGEMSRFDGFAALAQQSGQTVEQDSAQTERSRHRHSASNSQELIKGALEVASQIDPQLGTRLAALHKKNPAAFDRVMRQGSIGKNLFAMAHLRQRDPDLYQVKLQEMMQTVQVNRTAAQLRDAVRSNSAGQITQLQHQLKTQVQIQLAMEIKNRGDYICRIEEQLEKSREELNHLASSFQETVEARVKALIQQQPGELSEEDELNSQLNPPKIEEAQGSE